MALIAVVCVVGVVSGELLGPAAKLRTGGRTGDDESFAGRSAIDAELADDTFQFAPDQPLLLEFLGPKLSSALRRHSPRPHLPPPVFSPVALLFDGDGRDGDEIILAAFQPKSDGFSGRDALVDANFTTPAEPTTFFSSFVQVAPYSLGTPPTSGGSGPPPPPVASAPEPGSWLLMIVGLGAVGSALRRVRTMTGRLPETCGPGTRRS